MEKFRMGNGYSDSQCKRMQDAIYGYAIQVSLCVIIISYVLFKSCLVLIMAHVFQKIHNSWGFMKKANENYYTYNNYTYKEKSRIAKYVQFGLNLHTNIKKHK